MIALVGSPFSARYARARREGPARAIDHVCMNVSLRGPRGRGAWCLTEHGADALARGPDALAIGGSSWTASGDELVVRLDERTAPLPGRVTGEVRVRLGARVDDVVTLDAQGRHRWWPLAPEASAEVRLNEPSVSFGGHAYVDAQAGDEPLEDAFRSWTWSRVRRRDDALVSFDVERRDGSRLAVSRRFAGGQSAPGPVAEARPLPRTSWRLGRACRSSEAPRLLRSLEDGPCYARALVETTLGAERALGVHEVLDLDRLRAGWVRFLMPFRTRRSA